jgi:diguanylate cyclase (GGDEF)-like protein
MPVVVAVVVATAAAIAAALLALRLARAAASRRRRSALPRQLAAIAEHDNLGHVLDLMVRAMDRPGLRGAAILLINERNELYFGAHRGFVDSQVGDIRLPVGQGVVGTVAAESRPIVVDDLDAPPPGVTLSNRSVGSNALTRSMIAVPVTMGGAVIGVLEMGCTRPRAFDQLDLGVLQKVAASVSATIAQANPLKLADEVLRRRVRELTSLQEAAEALNASLGLDVVLQAVADHAARVVRAPYAAVLNLEDGRVRNGAVHDVDARIDTAPVVRAVAEWLAAAAAGEEGAQAVHLAEPPADAPPVTDPLAPLRSAAMVRLHPAADAAAVLVVASPDPRGFDPAQVRLLDGIGNLANLAVANAVRYQRLTEAAITDPLTGLLRRSQFEQTLAETRGQPVSVLAVDVDHLKDVNDAGGHEAGDLLLVAVATTLRDRLGDVGLLSRTGGDEFAVLLPGFEAGTAVAVAEELRRSVHGAPVADWLVRISIGLGSVGAEGDPRSAWDAALEALGQAKRYGRDRVETRLAQAPGGDRRHTWDELIPQLFEEGRIEAVYQPIVRLADHHLVGYEALARPLGFPAQTDVEGLFTAAREAGLHRDLDWACRRAAVRTAAELPGGVPLFLNVGVWALIDPLHDVDQMLLLLRWTGISPSDVVLELSEREAVHDLDRLRTVMAAYRAHGFRFSIDDVGEGHSTLDMLAAGAPDYIKIARSLVSSADHPGARAAINAVVAFGRSASSTVVAEGVQTGEEAERMESMGVALGQGFWLGSPVRVGAHDVPEGVVVGRAAALAV